VKPPNWYRCRFKANEDDYRPVKWPPPGPYWCSGFGDGYNIVIAYVRSLPEVLEFWPEADDVEHTEESEIKFSDRFPKPDWWNPEARKAKG